MRALSTFASFVASLMTIGAIAVRVLWSKPTPLTRNGRPMYDVQDTPMMAPPKAPTWLATAAKWWLIIVAIGSTIILLIVVIFLLMSLSA